MCEKEVLHRILKGVGVVTSASDGRQNGCTVAWITQVSHRPPMIVVALHPKRYTYEIIKESRVFCHNILDENQIPLAKRFGLRSGRNFDKFHGIPWRKGVTGSPILEDAITYLDCCVTDEHPAGDHILVIGEVVDCAIQREGVPLTFRSTDYW